MDAETRKKIEATINEDMNPKDREALGQFLTTCFNLNDPLQEYQAVWANYGFKTACNYFRMEVLESMKEREAKLVAALDQALRQWEMYVTEAAQDDLEKIEHAEAGELRSCKRVLAEYHAAKVEL